MVQDLKAKLFARKRGRITYGKIKNEVSLLHWLQYVTAVVILLGSAASTVEPHSGSFDSKLLFSLAFEI